MDILRDKVYEQKDYVYRYATVPTYYNTVDNREITGIGTNVKKNALTTTHKLTTTDTLEYLSLKYYNNPSYWWYIAYYNNIQDPFIRLCDKYDIILIPNIGAVTFGEERVY